MYPREKTGRSEFEQTMDLLRFITKVYKAYMPDYPEQIFAQQNDEMDSRKTNALLEQYDILTETGKDAQRLTKMRDEIKTVMQQAAEEDDQFTKYFSQQTHLDDFSQQENEAYSRALRNAIWKQDYIDAYRANQRYLDINNLLFTTPGEAAKPFYTMQDWVNARRK